MVFEVPKLFFSTKKMFLKNNYDSLKFCHDQVNLFEMTGREAFNVIF